MTTDMSIAKIARKIARMIFSRWTVLLAIGTALATWAGFMELFRDRSFDDAMTTFSPEIGVLWATFAALVFYTYFTSEIVGFHRESSKKASTAALQSLRRELCRLESELQAADNDQRPTSVNPFDYTAIDYILRNGEFLADHSLSLIDYLVDLRESLRVLREQNAMLRKGEISVSAREAMEEDGRGQRRCAKENIDRTLEVLGGK